ncbi:MAG: ABC transporter ATP-binding protein/permease [Alphaproteobacteria bacterium]|nr:ABC transporter ATP-binding protein/permease [Alphaproteobacteria bacterium]
MTPSTLQRIRQFLSDLWWLAVPYWQSEERWSARGLLAIILAMNLSLVGISVLLNQWNNDFYNSLQEKNEAEFYRLLMWFCGYAALYILIAVYQLWLNQLLQIRWRRWLTDRYLDRYLNDHRYWRLQIEDRSTDNPDQRIADDIRQFVGTTLSITLGLINAVVTLVSFVGILWGLSGSITVMGVEIGGYMVWVALLYALIGSVLAHLIGKPLIKLSFNQERVEADFRFGLVRLRETVDGVALSQGEVRERAGFATLFGFVMANWRGIMTCQKRLTFFTVGYAQIATVFPFIVAAPRYFSGAIPLGGLMQTASAFGQVQSSLSWFIDTYPRLADWAAVVSRLTSFTRAMAAAAPASGTLTLTPNAAQLRLDGVRLLRPDGSVMTAPLSLTLGAGERVLLTGASGSGKTTLFRAIAGLWRHGEGQIDQPTGAMFLPQRPYLPLGSLRTALAYPHDPATLSDGAVEEVLAAVGLSAFATRLDEVAPWSQTLSGGEQQRLAFARALLHRPAVLFLDEATAALDNDGERHLYHLATARLPDTAILSIGHRDSLIPLHTRVVRMERA